MAIGRLFHSESKTRGRIAEQPRSGERSPVGRPPAAAAGTLEAVGRRLSHQSAYAERALDSNKPREGSTPTAGNVQALGRGDDPERVDRPGGFFSGDRPHGCAAKRRQNKKCRPLA